MPKKSNFKKSNSSILFIMAALLFTFTGWAQTSTFTSTTDGNWNDITWGPTGVPSTLDDVIINTTVTIPFGTPLVEVNNLTIGQSGKLIVNGYLKVNGNLSMVNNYPEFSMGTDAIVTVVGDFLASNQVEISVSSYLIIQGDFNKGGSVDQGTLAIDPTSLYIFGTADGFTQLEPAPNGDVVYGDVTAYVNDAETFPAELLALTSCFAISELLGQTVCTTNDVTFSIDPVGSVVYQWQEKILGGVWAITGTNSPSITIPNATVSMSGNKYRVLLTPVDTNSNCQIAISLAATLAVISENSWTGATSTDWNDASNWSCNSVPIATRDVLIPTVLTNYPNLPTGITGLCNNLTIQAGASLVLTQGTIQINGILSNSGSFDAQVGTVNFTGSAAQTIPANSFLNNRVKNLTLSNSSGVTNSGSLNITGILKATTGDFNTTGSTLTLVSDAAQTALIDGSGNGTITGNVTMQRLVDPAFGYKLISAPVQGVTVGDFSSVVDLSSTFETFYTYDENREISTGVGATGYIPYVDPSGILGVFKGYAVNFGGVNSPKTVEVTGTVTSGPQSINLSNNNGTYTKGFNLVGNPYPSPIDWAAGGWTKTNVDNALYFFTTSGIDQYTGVYTSAVNGAGGPSVIPSMQGFFVHVTDGAYPVSAVLSLTDAVRVNNFSNEFVKSPEEQKKTITLSAKFDDSNLKDDLLFYFDRSASKGFDSCLDALKLMNTDPSVPNLYCLTNTKQAISINAIPDIIGGTETVIPLGISTAVNNWVTISLNHLPYDLASNYIYLIDMDENKVIDLQQKSKYRFFGNAGKNESRFELRISNTPISIDEVIFDELFSLDNSNGTIKVKMNLNRGEVGDIKVASLTGQILDTHFVANKDVVEITGIKSTGLYIISFYTTNGVFSKKVIIKN